MNLIAKKCFTPCYNKPNLIHRKSLLLLEVIELNELWKCECLMCKQKAFYCLVKTHTQPGFRKKYSLCLHCGDFFAAIKSLFDYC